MTVRWYDHLNTDSDDQWQPILGRDWNNHPLGAPETWPSTLTSALRIVLASVHPMYICWGEDLICLHNAAFRALLPPERKDVVFGHSARLIWSDLWDEVGADLQRALEGQASFQTDKRILLSRSGRTAETFWTYSYTPLFGLTPDVASRGVLVICSETTPVVIAARSADEERQRLMDILDQAPAFVAVLRGPDYIYEFSNAAHDRLVENRPIMGKPVIEALPELLSQGSLDVLKAVYTTGEPFIAQGMQVALERSETGTLENRYLDFIFQPLEWSEDEKRILVLGFDMTDRTRAEQALRQARAEAEASNMAKSQFLANMSHELRTPMNAIVSLGYILEGSDSISDTQRRYLSVLRSSADSLLDLIDDLLDASSFEARGVRLDEKPFQLRAIVDEVAGVMKTAAHGKALEFYLETNLHEGDTFLGDPRRVRQILTHLCGNAIKFTERGCVRLNVRHDDSDGNRITIIVEDTGIGIPSEKVDEVFQSFVQADASTTRKFGGTGLGLSLVKAIISAMSGTISVNSSMGSGTRFTVEMPLRTLDHPIPLQTTPEGLIDAGILIVDDYEANLFVTAAVLEDFGYPLMIARSGTEAVDLARSHAFRAILMDVQMPEMDGFAATRCIREIEEKANRRPAKIIGFTAYALEGDRKRCLAAGMDDYLAKPARPADIMDKLGDLQQPGPKV